MMQSKPGCGYRLTVYLVEADEGHALQTGSLPWALCQPALQRTEGDAGRPLHGEAIVARAQATEGHLHQPVPAETRTKQSTMNGGLQYSICLFPACQQLTERMVFPLAHSRQLR